MLLDVSSRRNLELTGETMREKNKKGSLLSVLDKTRTAMGARLLRKWVEQPLLSKEEINQRLDGVEELFKTCSSERKSRKFSIPCMTLNALCPVVVYQNANAKGFGSTEKFRGKSAAAEEDSFSRCENPYLSTLQDRLDTLENIHALIAQSIVEPAVSVRGAA